MIGKLQIGCGAVALGMIVSSPHAAAEDDADELAKLLNPGKTVLIPDLDAGCSLAASITAADVRLLRERYPGVPVVTYVNTSAAVKAESDICCTSGNARKVIESLEVDRVIMLPDEYLAQNVAAETGVKIITWAGHCEVHERFTAAEIRELKKEKQATILAHYYQEGEIQELADHTGDSLQLARAATKVTTPTIVFCGVHFMAETAKILNPTKRVLLPDLAAGCSLADSCPAEGAGCR